ncbi:MAG: beta-ketoacyl-ACP synthase III [Myxococcaceae bacterium]|nr:beta-ketoacyl-ACP synthase III [Myxococcaceae bacterium]
MSAFITHISSFLPNGPIDNDTMESVLGLVNGKRSRARALVLRSNGIKNRHYAIDPASGQQTHTNAQLTAEAVRRLLDAVKLGVDEVPLLACGTATPDQLMPAHGFMTQGELKAPPAEVFTVAGSCTSSMSALRYATIAVGSGQVPRAVVTGSELCSALMHARHFRPELDDRIAALEKEPRIAFEYEFLRWMLSDGAGAVLVEPEARQRSAMPVLKIHWVDSISFAGQLDTCMYHLARKREDGSTETWKQVEPSEWLKSGFFNLGQDSRMLGENIGRVMGDSLAMVMKKRKLGGREVDWLLPHISSAFFRSEVKSQAERVGLFVPEERVFTNLAEVGNVGAASVFLMLEELVTSGRAKKGEKILCSIPESARFNASYALLEVM